MNMNLFSENATVILVHGAWADGSSWSEVILPLRHQGLKVICAPIPLTSLSDDAAALSRVLERVDGPSLLAGHAYAGAVIAAADCGCLHSGSGAETGVEVQTLLVPDRGRRSHDQPKDAALHGRADGSEDPSPSC
jgi:hypothetical protein